MKSPSNINPMLRVMHILSWVIFLWLCGRTVAILLAFVAGVYSDSRSQTNLAEYLHLDGFYQMDQFHLVVTFILMTLISGCKTWLFYLVIKIFSVANLQAPFRTGSSGMISQLCYVALNVGLLSGIIVLYVGWLNTTSNQPFVLPADFTGGAEYLFFAMILYIISLMFRRDIEAHNENETNI